MRSFKEVIRGEVRIAPRYLLSLPTGQFLKRKEWCSGLHVPTGPGVPQVVRAKISDASSSERLVPGLRAELVHRLAFVLRYKHGMPPDLLRPRDCAIVGRADLGEQAAPGALAIEEADVRAYCTAEKPVARVVILALERVVEYARNGDHEEMRLKPLCERRDLSSPILELRWGVLRSRDVR
jgi:hypothetical protein